ncbi:ribulokinase [Acidipropionibacterium virtanenii]|uniref:Ribulokinase n=1 Tax=Acidipropionibacterium virtanenii TaxID=2057246 RepID=A0A344UVN0_9ACTN|nr:ribulokinase [Acidipropionibacterium virtanenii]AXE39328.1 Ribulokinase [Acidipropionibacterium virtanenii]
MSDKYVIGLDYGTLSGRALVVRVSDGAEMGTDVYEYPHAVMDRTLTAADNQKLPPDFALQSPADYIETLEHIIPGALKDAAIDPSDVIGIGLDVTSATVIACRSDGTPLCLLEDYADEPHAWVKLWKHHGAQDQADRIVKLAQARREPWLARYGGILSSEMLMPKVLETLEWAPRVYEATDVFCDALDWLTWQLTGELTFAAGDSGYKRMYQDGQYPSREFLRNLNPEFEDVFETKMDAPVLPLGGRVGGLTADFAARLGLPEGIAVASGNIDAHVTAAAIQAVENGQMTAILGTSACYIVPGPELKEVPGMFGVVDGGIVDGSWGFEAGQTAVGDIFAWFIDNCVPKSYADEAERRAISLHELLTEKCQDQEVGAHGLIGLDWHNGNRSVLADANLSGLLIGQALTTTPEDQYRALLESTAFGARTIIESFRNAGVAINELIVAGGLTKNTFLMQLLCDICRVPLSVGLTQQPGARGSAVFGAVAAGVYPDVKAASAAMGAKEEGVYQVDEERARLYDPLFAEYTTLHDYFGRGANPVMHRLKELRREAHIRAERKAGPLLRRQGDHSEDAWIPET